MKLSTKLIAFFAMLAAIILFAAGPPPGTFIVPSFFTTNGAKIYGTNGIAVSSNAPTGIYLIDGRNLTNGLSGGGSNYVFNQNQFSSTAGGTNISIKSGALVTNLHSYQTNIIEDAVQATLVFTNGVISHSIFTDSLGLSFHDLVNGYTTLALRNDGTGVGVNPDNNGGISHFSMSGIQTLAAQDSGLPADRTLAINADGEYRLVIMSSISGDTWYWTPTNTESIVLFTNRASFHQTGPATFYSAITNLSLSASSLMKSDANDKESSIANGTGALTNNSAGGFGWFSGFLTAADLLSKANMTNALLWDGPTNGSVGAKILTAGTGISLTTVNNTNRQIASTIAQGISVQSNAFGGTVGSGTNLLLLTSSNLLLTATNTATAGGTNSASFDTIQPITTTANVSFAGITNSGQTANTILSLNANKKETSIANPLAGGGQSLVFNGTNGYFQSIHDGWICSEEFLGVAGSTAGSIGREAWSSLSSVGAQLYVADTNWGVVDLTNGITAGSRAGYVLGSSTGSYVVTNSELWCYFRVKVRNLNSSLITNYFLFGLSDLATGNPNNGIFIRHAQTNNIWEFGYATNNVVGTNTFTSNVVADVWREFAWHLDTSQTNVVYFMGTNPDDIVPVATNNFTLPTAALSLQIWSRRQVATAATIITNSVDHAYLWKRRLW